MVSWICFVSMCGYELNWKLDMFKWTYLFVAVTFIVLGNYLPKVKQNYFLGIKLPWTLHDEENWDKTHKLAGKLWVIAGILMIIAGLLNLVIISMIILFVSIIVPTFYSYLLYKNKK